MTHTLTVDLSNTSATITTPDGRVIRAWSGVTRRSSVQAAERDGWRMAGGWELTSPPDGFHRPVISGDDRGLPARW